MEQERSASSTSDTPVTLFLCGDVMTGRGIDQILPHSVDPILYERSVRDAGRYVTLAERENGPIPRDADPSYVWGEALEILRRVSPDLRIVNLETAVTTSSVHWPGKGVHYRMHPKNVSCLTAVGLDCCVLANNHVLDWGYAGLEETLHSLEDAGIQTAGAGENLATAQEPATFDVAPNRRVHVFGVGSTSSGIPSQWQATKNRPGVHLVDETDRDSVAELRSLIDRFADPDDVIVVSIHWGPNWGYDVSTGTRQFAHSLIDDAGVDLIHGHSSHHVKGIEIYDDRPILYGCGDFLTDYEGIKGREEYRDDLGLTYFARLDSDTRQLERLEMHPTQIRNFQITRPDEADVEWLARTLQRESQKLGTGIARGNGNVLVASSP